MNAHSYTEAGQDLSGKICLVTGATSGIGQATATALAAMGAQVIVAGRNPEKACSTVQEISRVTGNSRIDFLLADFSDVAQVRAMAQLYKERFPRLDILVNNAGAYFNRRRLNPAGVEYTFLVNHLASFILTNALLETLAASQPARIVNVSSGWHRYGNMDFNDLSFQRGYTGLKAYHRSKLANVLFTYELARRLTRTQVTANVVNPGLVTTDIWRTNFSILGPLLKWIVSLRGQTIEQGAMTLIQAAASPSLEGVTGRYFSHQREARSSPLSYDEQLAQRLWDESERLAG